MKNGLFLRKVFLVLMATGAGKTPAFSGNESSAFGPAAFSSGQTSSLFRDVWSVFNNPGALGYLNRNAAAVSYERRFSAFSMPAFAAAGKFRDYGTFGFGASRFGPEFFNQSRAGISWGKTFGIASVGLQGQWYQVSARDLNTRHYFLLNFGGIARLGDKLFFSGCIQNLSQTKSKENDSRVLPTLLKAGLAWQANTSLLLMAEIQKDLDEKAGINAGIEYRFVKNAFFRSGFSTAGKSGSMGMGIRWREFQLDAGSNWHPELGFSHCFGLQYYFGKEAAGKDLKP